MIEKINSLFLTKNKKLFTAVFWLFIALAVIVFSLKFNDTDLYYLITTGNWILENGTIPSENPFITTPGQGIVIQNWLYCILVAFVYKTGGSIGLWLLQIAFILMSSALVFKFLKRRDIMGAFFCIFFLTIFRYSSLRPQFFTFILCMLEILAIEKYNDTGKVSYLYLLPLTTFLEINGHGSYWIMHFVILLPYIVPVPKLEDTSIKDKKKLIPPVLLMIASSFLNPYGLEGVLYIFKSLASPALKIITIQEQNAMRITEIYALVLIALIVLMALKIKNKEIDSVTFWMFFGFTILGIAKIKFASMFALGVLFLLRRCKAPELKLDAPVVFSLLMVFVLGVFGKEFIVDPETMKIFDNTALKEGMFIGDFGELDEIADYLDEKDPEASILARFQNSNYFEFRGYTVYYDARPEIYVKEVTGDKDILGAVEKIYARNNGIAKERGESEYTVISLSEWDKEINEVEVDYLLTLDSDYSLNERLDLHNNYELVFETENFNLFKKN